MISNPQYSDLSTRMDALERRVKSLEKSGKGRSFFGNSTRVLWRDDDHDPTPDAPPPFVSQSVQLSERLTSFEFAVKATAGQAGITAAAATLVTTAGALLLGWQWHTPLVVGVCAGTVSWLVLVIDHRGLLHKAVNNAKPKAKRQQELKVQITAIPKTDGQNDVERLFIKADVSPEQLRRFAQSAAGGESLRVHNWIGEGSLFTRGQYDTLMSELERMGYVLPGSGNKPRRPTAKGRAFLRAVAE